MSRIKILYDVFKTMKDKEVFNGDVKVETLEKGKKIFTFSNEFSTNNKTGATKAKISTEIDYEDNKLKHESTTEFNLKDKHYHHGGRHGMRMHGKHPECSNGSNIKNKLSHVTFMLGVLNKIKVEEDGDKTLLSLDLKEIIKEIKEMAPELNDKAFEEMKENRGQNHHAFVKKFMDMETTDANLKVWINKSNEVEKIEILANGNKNVTADELCEESFKLLLKLAW